MTIRIRFRVDFGDQCSVGFGKIELLEAIERTGSLSQAARSIDMSYRRAWVLVDSMNAGFAEPVVRASTGGAGGGGASLTEFGRQLIDSFRELQPKLDALTAIHMRSIGKRVSRSQPAARAKRTKSAAIAPRHSLAKGVRGAAAK